VGSHRHLKGDWDGPILRGMTAEATSRTVGQTGVQVKWRRRCPSSVAVAILAWTLSAVVGPVIPAQAIPSLPTIPAGSTLAGGGAHTCVLTLDGAAECWGQSEGGGAMDQLGPYFAITAGTQYTCALTLDGAADCWGNNGVGQAEDYPGPYRAISAHGSVTCALTMAGAADCWGANGWGGADDQPGPFVAVYSGNHSCGLTPTGAVDCWGRNDFGQAVDQPGPYVAIGVGDAHTCALTPTGTTDCWGVNGAGEATGQPGPYEALTVGGSHACGLTASGAADCWGTNSSGQADDQAGPFVTISGGNDHTCALTAAGAAECWGANNDGQLDDEPGPFLTPTSYQPDLLVSPPGSGWKGGNVYSIDATGQTAPTARAVKGAIVTIRMRIQNDGNEPDRFSLKVVRRLAGSTPNSSAIPKINYLNEAGKDITSAFKGGTYSTKAIGQAGFVVIRARVQINPKAKVGTHKSWRVTARSRSLPVVVDTVEFAVRVTRQ
jgi:Regulator of chromosome condensation (RCC1) repeat